MPDRIFARVERALALPLIQTLLLWLAMVVLASLLLLDENPGNLGLSSDSGFFAYGGQRILAGDVLYRDIWDSKPPGVFYLNSLALMLGSGTSWSIWWFGLAWIAATIALLILVLRASMGFPAAMLAAVFFTSTLACPDYYQGGNYPEVYALLLQIGTLGSAGRYFRSKNRAWILLIGALTACALLLKPTTTALGLASLALMLYCSAKQAGIGAAAQTLGLYLAGLAIPILLVALHWGGQSALTDLWNAVVVHNYLYVRSGFTLASLLSTFRLVLVQPPLSFLSLLATAGALVFILARAWRAERQPSQSQAIMAVSLLALPLEMLFIGISGRNFGHYFLAILPALTVAAGYLLSHLQPMASQPRRWRSASLLITLALLLGYLGVVWIQEAPGLGELDENLIQVRDQSILVDDLEEYVLSHTNAADRVLVWGYNPGLHFITGRRSSSKYLFHSHLFFPSGPEQTRFPEFLGELERNPPVLILARPESPHRIPYFGELGEALCPGCSSAQWSGMQALQAYVLSNYRQAARIGEWIAFEPIR